MVFECYFPKSSLWNLLFSRSTLASECSDRSAKHPRQRLIVLVLFYTACDTRFWELASSMLPFQCYQPVDFAERRFPEKKYKRLHPFDRIRNRYDVQNTSQTNSFGSSGWLSLGGVEKFFILLPPCLDQSCESGYQTRTSDLLGRRSFEFGSSCAFSQRC